MPVLLVANQQTMLNHQMLRWCACLTLCLWVAAVYTCCRATMLTCLLPSWFVLLVCCMLVLVACLLARRLAYCLLTTHHLLVAWSLLCTCCLLAVYLLCNCCSPSICPLPTHLNHTKGPQTAASPPNYTPTHTCSTTFPGQQDSR